ncbi:ribokinase [Tranquillimonas rosea]|uniref:ribokinase n=1 Tax=Tranquillimonas rosea TaxID=641238 RepID=UPI003BAAC1FD
MTIWNFGSINADCVYAVPHAPAPGETIAARALTHGLGGKGANQSVAAARAGATVHHIGGVGPDGQWAVDRLAAAGVDTAHVHPGDMPTGHAIITVADDGENTIVIFAGANAATSPARIAEALSGAAPDDLLLLQNETTCQVEAARIADEKGLRVVYSAAPFDAEAVRAVMPYVHLLVMNEGEAAALTAALGRDLVDLDVPAILVTRGADGADWITPGTGERVSVPAPRVSPVDTTGAGDTFTGYLAAGLDAGHPPAEAMALAAAAAALQVQRPGAADAIPSRDEVDASRTD